jgi:SAGA-associated factor 29
MLKLCEEERAILQDEPSDVIKNLGLLTALRQASEAEAPLSRAASLSKSRKKRNDFDGSATDSPGPVGGPSDKGGRSKGGTQRSTSASSTQVRDNVQVKIEEGAESAKATPAERNGQLTVGAEVVFKHNKNKQGVEGEGIQCIIKGITGEGNKKRWVRSIHLHFLRTVDRCISREDTTCRTRNPTRTANKGLSIRLRRCP